MRKEEWRNMITKLREDLNEKEWRVWSDLIHQQLCNSQIWKEASTISFFYSVGKEVDTLSLIQQAWKEGKQTYLPKCDPKQKEMAFYKIEQFEQLGGTYYGIPEPDPQQCERMSGQHFDLIIVPGLVFDEFGYRVGYGGGYYDRFLDRINVQSIKVGLAFPFQVVKGATLPNEAFDIPVNQIVTPDQIILCRSDR